MEFVTAALVGWEGALGCPRGRDRSVLAKRAEGGSENGGKAGAETSNVGCTPYLQAGMVLGQTCWTGGKVQTAAWQTGKEFLPKSDIGLMTCGLMTCGLMTCGVNDLDIPLSEVYLRPWTHSSNELQNHQVKLFPTSISVCPGAWKAEHRVCACPS